MKTILEHLSYMSILAFVLTTGSANAALRSNSTPSGRYNGSAAWDAVGQRLIGFGGTTGVSVNTVFTATSYGNTVNYATVVPAGTAPAPRNSQATCWDPDGRRLLIFGGEGAAGALGDVAVLTVTQQGMTWSAPAVAGTPPSARSGAACAWDRVGQRAFFFGGTAGVVQGDVWALDTAGGQFRWRALTAPNGPSARTHAMAVFDPVAGEMVVIGGYDGAAAVSETWVLTPRGDVGLWRRLAPVGAMPVARYAGVAEYDAAGHRVIVAMGALGNWNYTSSVQRLTLGPNPSWSAPAATGVLPTGRQLPYAGWDPVDRRLMITHGYSGVARSDGSVLTESDAGVVWTSLSTGSCETAPVAAQLTVPINDAVLATCPPTLSWTWAGGASTVGYRATVNGRALPFVSTTSRPVPGVDVIPGRNPWSVQVFGCDGAASGVSASSFMNNAAAPPAPVLNPVAALGCDASDAALSWTSAPGVTYDVTLNGQVVATGLTSGALTLPGETVYQANNAWSVTARACGQQVASAPGAFAANTAIVPQAPAISAPEANAVGYCDETFTWVAGGNPGGTRYRLDVIDAATGAVARSVTTRATTYTPSGAARLVTGRYRAQVTALNCLGASAAGGLRAFSVNNTPPVPLQVTPEFDAWGAAATAFTWGHAGAERDVRFDLLVDGAVVAADLAVAAAGERTTYILPAALPHGAHTWQVQAEGCFGESSNSGIPRAFRADANPPSAFALTSPADGGWTRGDAPIPLTFTESSETALEGIGDVTCTARVDGEVVGTARPPVNVIDARAGRLQSFGFEAPTPEFVSGGFANEWGRTNSVARTGQYSMAVAVDGTYTNNASSTLTTVESHTILQADALRFYVRGSVENGYDSLEVQLGTDATGFVTAAVIGNDYPVWTLMTPPLGQFIGRTVQIRFRFVSDGSVTDVGYRIDDLTIGNALPLTDGQHTWGVTCTDGAGNVRVSTPASFGLGIDTVNPTAPGLLSPSANGFVNAARPTFTWSAGTDALSGVGGYEVLINGALASGAAPLPAEPLTFTALQDLAEGAYRFSVRTVDRAGGRAGTAERPFTVDRTPPGPPVAVGPAGLSDDVGGRRYCWTDAVDNRSGVCGYRLWVDGAVEFDRISVPGAQRGADGCVDGLSFLPDGEHTWAVASIDCAGNVSAPTAPVAFVLETAPPAPFTATEPPNGTTVNTFLPLFCWNATSDAGSGVDHYDLVVDGQIAARVPPAAENGVICARPGAPLANGARSWAVRALDAALNVTQATGMPWALTVNRDVTPPTCTIDSPAAGALAGCVDHRFAGRADDLELSGRSGAGVARVEYQLDGTAGPWALAELGGSERNRSWAASWNGQHGEHTVYCRATDREGNVQAAPVGRMFRVDCAGPRAFSVSTPVENAAVSVCPTITWEATTDDLSALAGYDVLIDARPPLTVPPNLTRRTLIGDECLPGGAHSVVVRARDALGNATQTAARSFTVDTTGPVAFTLAAQAPVDNAGFTNAPQIVLSWTPSADLGGGLELLPYQVMMDGQPFGGRTAATQATWINPPDGEHVWTVVARDVFGNQTTANAPAPLGRFTVDRTGPDAGAVHSLVIDALDVPARPGVHAGQPRDTGLDVTAGEMVRVLAQGTLCYADDASCNPQRGGGGCYGPRGAEPAPANASRFYAQLPFGALYAIVAGHPESPLMPDVNGTLVAPFSGRLHLGVNDNDTYNCRSRWLSVAVLEGAGYNLIAPARGTYTRETRPMFQWTPVTDAGVGVQRLALLVDGRVVAGEIAADAVEFMLPENAALVEGEHRWQVAAEDRLGNRSTSDEFILRVDRTPPEPFDVTTPRAGEVVDRAQPELCWAATRDLGAGLAHWLVDVDGNYNGAQYPDARTCVLPSTPLADGPHCFSVVAQDALLWERRSQTQHCFTVDTAPPAAFALIAPAPGLSFNSRPEFCWSPSADAGTGLARYEIFLSGNRMGVVDASTTCFQPDAPIPNGDHVWFVRAVDGAGAVTTSEQRVLRIERDLTAPDVRVDSPMGDTLHGEAGIGVVCAADDGDRGTGVVAVQVESPAGGVPVPAAFDEDLGLWRATWPVDADGTATVCCRATDGEGNRNPDVGAQARACVTVRTDVSPPGRFAVTAPVAGGFVPARATFAFTAAVDAPAGLAGYRLVIDGPRERRSIDAGVRVRYTLSADEALADGDHTVTVTAVDALGHARAADTPVAFRVDAQNPEGVTLLSPADGAALDDASPVLCYTAGIDRGNSGICGHRLTLDGVDTDVPAETTCVAVGPLERGDHAFTAAAVDCAGNVGAVAAPHLFRVDLTPPPAPALVLPDDGAYVTPPVALRWAEVQDVAGLDHTGLSVYRVTVDGETVERPAASPTGTWPDDFGLLPGRVVEGRHTLRVRAVDAAGNTSASSSERTFVVDATAPVGLSLLSPVDGELAAAVPFVRWTAAQDAGAGICGYTVTVDGVPQALPPGSTEASLGVLGEGAHTLVVTATDCVGLATTVLADFVLDTLPPSAPVLEAPFDGACVATDRPELSWRSGVDATSGVVASEVFVDGLLLERLDAVGTRFTPGVALGEGRHTWSVRSVDAAGHASQESQAAFEADVQAPSCVFLRSERAADGEWALIFAARDLGCGLEAVEASVDGHAAVVFEPGAAEYRVPLTADVNGVARVTCVVRDRAGATGTARTTLGFDDCLGPGPCDPLSDRCGSPFPDGDGCDDGDPCTEVDACRAGRCVGSPLECETPPPDDCLDGAARHFARGGACVDGACAYPSTVEACVRSAASCEGDVGRCEAGACIFEPASEGEACEDGTACTRGDVCDGQGRCRRGAVVACDEPPPTRCLDAGTAWIHAAFGACEQGACVYAAQARPCALGCDAATGQCIGEAACEGVDCVEPPGPCFEVPGNCRDGRCDFVPRPAGTPCGAADACREPASCDGAGNCLPGAAVRCDDLPDPFCVDATTSRTFVGVCGDGGCEALSVDTSCPSGCDGNSGRCAGGSCDGVTCQTPPGPCFAAEGHCIGGACVYGAASADLACDDGDPCSADDRCDGTGRCAAGAGVVCDAPPAAACVDDTTLQRWLPVGQCTSGVCEYPREVLPCAFGCDGERGACRPEPCAGKRCETPPDGCHDASGTCEDGLCVYAASPEGTPCDDGDPCTLEDTCGGAGRCGGTSIACPLPAPACEADVLVVAVAGRCEVGACAFEMERRTCESGCVEGACVGSGPTEDAGPPPDAEASDPDHRDAATDAIAMPEVDAAALGDPDGRVDESGGAGTSTSGGGCGCRTGREADGTGWGAFVIGVLGLLRRRRRSDTETKAGVI